MTHSERTPASSIPGKRPLAPDLRRLDDRAMRAWTEAMAVRPLGDGRYAVDSDSGATYVVDLPASDCSCPDHEIRGERCKHIRRVAIEINERRIPPPYRSRDSCVICGREAFVPEDGPSVCDDCWLSPGTLATDRETGDTLIVVGMTTDRADERRIETAGCTVAEYPHNEGYPADDPVVEVAYPFSGRADASLEDRPRYSFPYSRVAPREEVLIE